MLGHPNPSQVGNIDRVPKKTFQAHFPPRKIMQAVIQWHFEQSWCADCGTRLELQADTSSPARTRGDEADRLENMTLRCRRCNVIRRPSHKQGGKTFLTAEAALMWILFIKRPRTYQLFETLCPRLRHDDGEHPLPGGLGHGDIQPRAAVRDRSRLEAVAAVPSKSASCARSARAAVFGVTHPETELAVPQIARCTPSARHSVRRLVPW